MLEIILGWTIVIALAVLVLGVPALYLLAAIVSTIVSLGNMRESDND